MKFKDYVNEHYIFEKAYNTKSLIKQLANYYKMPLNSDPGEVMQNAGSIDNALSIILKVGDTFTADEEVQDPETGEVYFEKGYHKSGNDVAILNKKTKQKYRNAVRQVGKNTRKAESPPLFKSAKDISDFSSFYDLLRRVTILFIFTLSSIPIWYLSFLVIFTGTVISKS